MEIKKITWTNDLDSVLLPVLNDDFEAIKKEVLNGVSELFYVVNHGHVITRIEEDHNGKPYELVFIGGIGKDAKPVIKHFTNLAKYNFGIKKYRIHSQRKGMERYLSDIGVNYVESVYRGVIA